MKRMIAIVLCVVTIVSLTACFNIGVHANTCVPLSEAPKETREQIAQLSGQVVRAIIGVDAQALKENASDQFTQNTEELENMLEQMNSVVQGEWKDMDEFYITSASVGNNTISLTPDISDPPYYFYITPVAKEMAVLFSTVEQGAKTYIIAQSFTLENNAWRLYGISIGDYKINDMDAPAIYQKALEMKENGEIIPAALYAQLLQGVLQPANMISFPNALEMQDFITETSKQANTEYEIPFSIETSKSEFKIVGIQAGGFEEGIVCTISYISPTALLKKNEDKLKEEGKSIVDVIDRQFPGLSEKFDIFRAKAFEELPDDENKQYVNYTVVIEY